MTKQYHTRIIQLSYDSELPKFQTDEEHQAWLAALGRMVAYSMAETEEEGVVELVNIQIDKRQEITGCYFARLPSRRTDERGEKWFMYSFGELVQSFVAKLITPRPFVIGAVKRENNEWTYHS